MSDMKTIFAALTGSPIAGALVSRGNGSYLHAQNFAGLLVFVGTGMIAVRGCSGLGLVLGQNLANPVSN